MPKIKVFLGAFVNQTNAQNLSCRALARYLDKERFEVYTLAINHGNLSIPSLAGVSILNCYFPIKFFGVLGFLWGFWKADVIYLPNARFLKWQKLFSKLYRKKKTFKTMRLLLNDVALNTIWSGEQTDVRSIKDSFQFADRLYAITPFMRDYHRKRWGMAVADKVLCPLSELIDFKKQRRIRLSLSDILFLGKDWNRKGLVDFIKMANAFPSLQFHVVGSGDPSRFTQLIENGNILFYGVLSGDVLIDSIEKCDLHFLPSRAEGLPRGYIEALANGLPTLLYNDYGMNDFINHEQDGFIVSDEKSAVALVQEILNKPDILEKVSKNCLEVSEKYSPEILVKAYEKVILELAS